MFVCHASVDKARLVEPLVAALVGRCGLSVWLDRFEIAPGDAIGAAIDRGLVGARFAVVVVSPQFWTDWTAQELGGLYALEARDAAGRSRLIPVWAGVNEVDVETKSPRLAARRAIKAEAGIDNVARQIADHARAVAPRPLGRSPSYGVPKRRAQAFVGRELDVATLEAALAPGGVPVPTAALAFDYPVMLAASVACLPIFLRKHEIARWEGAMFFGYYIAYTLYLLLNASHHAALPYYSGLMMWFVIPLTTVTVLTILHREYRWKASAP